MIPFLCQTFLELIYVIFIMINNTFWDDPASASIFAGIAQMTLNDFIHKKHGYSSSIQNSLVKVTNLLKLREKCPNTELFLVRIFLYSVRIWTPYLDTFHAKIKFS